MASEVIELGSSDDEEPTPKKSKHLPNAMVHIPNKLPGVTIKRAKQNNASCNGIIGKVVTIPKNPNINFNQNLLKIRTLGKQNTIVKRALKPPPRPIAIGNSTFLNTPCPRMPHMQTMSSKKPGNMSKTMIKIQGAGCLSNLPPTITVKRTKSTSKHITPYMVTNVRKKMKINKDEIKTVDLVEDNVPTSSGPQWYIRPEEQTASTVLEEQNNIEPDKSKFIEITIEDSPVKPTKVKKKCKEKVDLSITIEDSPNKPECDRIEQSEGSDEENSFASKRPHSKKKLMYPKTENKNNISHNLIEVQLNPLEGYENGTETLNLGQQQNHVDPIIVEIEESPLKNEEPLQNSTPKKKSPLKPVFNNAQIKTTTEIKNNDSEFHPVYQSFINLCFELENSDDMKIIVEKKIKAYYRQVPKEYTESEDFIDMVSSKILAMKAGPEKMYLYIKDIVDELNFKRKSAKSQAQPETSKDTESNKHLYGEGSEFDSKRQRQIRRLEKTLKKLHRAIQKLEEQEVDFDDEEDSVYLLTERYKERLIRVHAKFCQLTNTKMPSEPRVQIDPRPGQPKGPAKRLEKWINKKVPMGTPLPFPDFHDVLRCVRDANKEDNLGWNEADIMEEARDLFTRCGKKLQRRRQENEWRIAASRISVDVDPAESNEELKIQLHKNYQMATKRETDVFKKYADRQNQLKLEAEEIEDKEAEESPIDSDDEDANADVTSLETTEKRKERLKRLIHEKSKKSIEESKCEVTQSVDPIDKLSTHLDNNKEQSDLQPDSDINVKQNVEDNESSSTKNKNNANITEGIISQVIEAKTINPELEEKEKMSICDDNAQSVSDDSNKIESDIDELHLLQKLHSENEINASTVDSSDTDTPIAISDTLDSNSDDKKSCHEDVISIENSSYSETENSIDKDTIPKEKGNDTPNNNDKANTNVYDKDTEIHIEKNMNTSTNNEYNVSIENILLASSDDDDEDDLNNDLNIGADICLNLEDTTNSTMETSIQVQNDIVNKETPRVKAVEDVKDQYAIENEGKCLDIAVVDVKHKTNADDNNPVDNLLKISHLDSDTSQLKITGKNLEEIKKTNENISSNDEIGKDV